MAKFKFAIPDKENFWKFHQMNILVTILSSSKKFCKCYFDVAVLSDCKGYFCKINEAINVKK